MDYTNQIVELKEKRQNNLNIMDGMVARANEKNEQVNEEEWDRYLKEDRQMETDISRLEFLQKRAQEAAAKRIAKKNAEENGENKETVEARKEYRRVFDKYMRYGGKGLTSDEITLISSKEIRGTDPQTTAATEGGYTIPEGFSNELFVEMAEWGGVRAAARVISTSTGNPIPWPTVDDTSAKGSLLTEGTAETVNDMAFDRKMLNAYTYTSKFVKVSLQLLQDTAFDLEAFLREAFARRLGTATNEHYTTGSGSARPNGFLTAGRSGLTAASATAITRAELVDLIHSVDPAYRKGGSVGFMFNDSVIAAIKKLSIGSADDRPLWQPSIAAGEPDRLEGFQYWVNQDMPNLATGNKSIAFGDFSKYIIRDAGNIAALRLGERFADELMVGYLAYLRTEGELLSANAIKYITMA